MQTCTHNTWYLLHATSIYVSTYLLKVCVDDTDKTAEKQLKGGNQESGLYAQQLSVASSRYDIWYQAIFFNNILIVRICPKNTSHCSVLWQMLGLVLPMSAPQLPPCHRHPSLSCLSSLLGSAIAGGKLRGNPGILYYGINLDLVIISTNIDTDQ